MTLLNDQILEGFMRQTEATDAGRYSTITGNLRENLLSFVLGKAVLNSTANA
jgi:hypothetical protein